MIPKDAEPVDRVERWPEYSYGDPLSDIVTAVCRFANRTDSEPNTLALSREHMIWLARHPDVICIAKEFGQIISVIPKPEQIAVVLGLNVVQDDGLERPMVYLATPDTGVSGECAQCGATKIVGRVTCPGCGAGYKE